MFTHSLGVHVLFFQDNPNANPNANSRLSMKTNKYMSSLALHTAYHSAVHAVHDVGGTNQIPTPVLDRDVNQYPRSNAII